MPLPPEILCSPKALTAVELGRLRGRRILILLAEFGQAVQEVVDTTAHFEAAGCEVVYVSLDGGTVGFCPLTIALAIITAPFRSTLRLLRRAAHEGRFSGLPSLRAVAGDGPLDAWLAGFAAVIVPGGHGRVFRDFIRDPLTVAVISHFQRTQRPIGLLCHAPAVATGRGAVLRGLVAGKTVTCWPRNYEALFRHVPGLRGYLVPFGTCVTDLLTEAGAVVRSSPLLGRRIHAVVDSRLVTGRGPDSGAVFASGILAVMARRAGGR